MHSIDEFIILNLPAHIERKWACIGSLTTSGFDLGKLRFWDAIPGTNFADTRQICEAAADDGFPEFLKFYNEEKYGIHHYVIGNTSEIRHLRIVSQAWSYFQMLRHVSENGINALIMYDDYIFKNYDILAAIVETVMRADDFLFLQCEYYHIPAVNLMMEIVRHPNIPCLAQGPLGASENVIFYSHQGATFFLDYLQQNFHHNIEATLQRMCYLPSERRQGIWTAIDKLVRTQPFDFGSTIVGRESSAKTLDGTTTDI